MIDQMLQFDPTDPQEMDVSFSNAETCVAHLCLQGVSEMSGPLVSCWFQWVCVSIQLRAASRFSLRSPTLSQGPQFRITVEFASTLYGGCSDS